MCGIIGYHGPRTEEALQLIIGCMLQAGRRGTHATGIAFLEAGELCIFSQGVGVVDFIANYDLAAIAPNEETLSFVAHTRYSTSDLAWNQPLEDEECALVLNGVISQHPPERWPLAELEPYKTGNDVEVALRYAKEGMRGETPGSFAILELWRDGRFYAYRNGDRPLYWAPLGPASIYASTHDILHRNGVADIRMVDAGLFHRVDEGRNDGDFAVGPDAQEHISNPDLELRRLRCPLA